MHYLKRSAIIGFTLFRVSTILSMINTYRKNILPLRFVRFVRNLKKKNNSIINDK